MFEWCMVGETVDIFRRRSCAHTYKYNDTEVFFSMEFEMIE